MFTQSRLSVPVQFVCGLVGFFFLYYFLDNTLEVYDVNRFAYGLSLISGMFAVVFTFMYDFYVRPAFLWGFFVTATFICLTGIGVQMPQPAPDSYLRQSAAIGIFAVLLLLSQLGKKHEFPRVQFERYTDPYTEDFEPNTEQRILPEVAEEDFRTRAQRTIKNRD